MKNDLSPIGSHNIAGLFLSVLMLVVALPATAQQNRSPWIFGLNAEASTTNNFYLQSSNEVSAAAVTLKPRISYQKNLRNLQWQARANGAYATHSTSAPDNYADTSLFGQIKYIGTNQELGAALLGRIGHDEFGTQRTEGNNNTNQPLDRWREPSLSIMHRWGTRKTSVITTEAEVGALRLRYTSNRDETTLLDRDETKAKLAVLLNVSAKTSFLISAGYSEVDFPLDPNARNFRNGTSTSYLAGVRWQATAKTYGDARFGIKKRESDGNIEQGDSESWQVNIGWDPTKSTEITLGTSRSDEPSYQFTAPYIDIERHSLSWKQQWNRQFSSILKTSLVKRKFGPNDERPDNKYQALLQLTHHLDKGFDIYVAGKFKDFDDTGRSRDYARSDVIIGINLQLN